MEGYMKQNLERKWILMAIFLAGCGGEDLAERLNGDATQATYQVKAVASSTANARLNPRGAISIGTSGVTLTTARLSVERVDLKLPEGLSCSAAGFVAQANVTCEEEMEIDDSDGEQEIESKIRLQGPFVFDLLTGASTPDLGTLTVPSGIYREVEVDLHEAEAEDGLLSAGDPLIGNTLHVEGTYTGVDGSSQPFSMALDFDEEIEIESPGGVQVLEGDVEPIATQLDVSMWFAGVDLSACAASGSVDIDDSESSACDNLEETIKENIKNSFEFEDDDDDDSSDDSIDDSGNDGVGDSL
jgi:hypothetical protein